VPGARGDGISAGTFDADAGAPALRAAAGDPPNPSYLASGWGDLFAVSECFESAGSVARFALEAGGALRERWRASSRGLATCHLSVNEAAGAVYAASYLDGRLVALAAEDGRALFAWRYEGSGPDPERQEAAHAHQAMPTPDGAFLLVPDLGSDAVWRHPLREGVPAPPERLDVAPGAGPRHLVFHPERPLAYVLGELDGRVHAVDWNAGGAAFEPVSAAPEGWTGAHAGSAIRRHPAEPFLYAAHRASETVAVFRLGADGALERRATFPAGGAEPRDFNLSPDGRWLLVACQNDHTIAVHRLERPDRRAETREFGCGSPACLHWLGR